MFFLFHAARVGMRGSIDIGYFYRERAVPCAFLSPFRRPKTVPTGPGKFLGIFDEFWSRGRRGRWPCGRRIVSYIAENNARAKEEN